MIVSKQKDIEFINSCGAIVDYDLLAQAIYWYQSKPTARLKRIYLHGKYPAVSVHNKKIHIHRLIFMFLQKRILNTAEYVHHKDGDKLNCDLGNLVLMAGSEHQSYHGKRRMVSERQRQSIILFNRTRKNTRQPFRRKNVDYNGVHYMFAAGMSLNKIANILNCDWSTVRARLNDIHDNPELLKTE